MGGIILAYCDPLLKTRKSHTFAAQGCKQEIYKNTVFATRISKKKRISNKSTSQSQATLSTTHKTKQELQSILRRAGNRLLCPLHPLGQNPKYCGIAVLTAAALVKALHDHYGFAPM